MELRSKKIYTERNKDKIGKKTVQIRNVIKILQADEQIITDLKERKWSGSQKQQLGCFVLFSVEPF